MTRNALILASTEYQAAGLRQLRAPSRDAEALARVLRDPQIGGFEVRTLLNEPAHVMSEAVEEFFADRTRDDLLVAHFSCHGVKDESGELYFAAVNTKLNRLGATAVSAEFVNRLMNRSRSRRVVLLLDCCYAGAFGRGMMARVGADVDIGDRFEGRGRAVITASSAMEYAFEGSELADTRELTPSVFTSALVEGLETGEADRDQDGYVALDELYDYVYDRVRATTPNQTPGKWTFALQGDLYIARRARPVSTPAPLPPELQQAVDHPLASIRASAVQELEHLLQSRHAGLVLAAKLTLERLTDDDSRMVCAAAVGALTAVQQTMSAELAAAEDATRTGPASAELAAEPEPAEPDRGMAESGVAQDAIPTGPGLVTDVAVAEPGGREREPVETAIDKPTISERGTSKPAAVAEPSLPAPGAEHGTTTKPPPPRLKLSTSELDFGLLPLNSDSPRHCVRIENVGGGALHARVRTSGSWLRLHQANDELIVGVDTTLAGFHQGEILVESHGGTGAIKVLAHVEPTGSPSAESATTTTIGTAPKQSRSDNVEKPTTVGMPPSFPNQPTLAAITGSPSTEMPGHPSRGRPASVNQAASQRQPVHHANRDSAHPGSEPRVKKAWRIGCLPLISLCCILFAAALCSVPNSTPTTGQECTKNAPSQPSAGTSESPTSAPKTVDALASRARDSTPLTIGELCESSYFGTTGTFTQTGWDLLDDCTTAVTDRTGAPVSATKLMRTLGCNQVVTITAVNTTKGCVVTFGAANFPSVGTVNEMINAMNGGMSSGAGTFNQNWHNVPAEGRAGWYNFTMQALGHWLVFAVGGYADGRNWDNSTDYTVSSCESDLMDGVQKKLAQRK